MLAVEGVRVTFGQMLGQLAQHDMMMSVRVRTDTGDYEVAAAHIEIDQADQDEPTVSAILDLGQPVKGQTELFRG